MRAVKGVIVKPDCTFEEQTFKQLSDYQKAVGGLIEAVRLYDYNGHEIACAYVDEEGIIKGKEMNPFGGALSFVFGNEPYLLGNVVIVGAVDNDGEDTDIPDFILSLIKKVCGTSIKE